MHSKKPQVCRGLLCIFESQHISYNRISVYNVDEVAPAELEAALLTHESVQDACVVGRNDERVGELPTAFVVVKQNHRVTGQQLTDYVAGKN